MAYGVTVFVFSGHKDSVICTEFSHDAKFVATGDMSGIIKVWDVETCQEVWSFETSDLEVCQSFNCFNFKPHDAISYN